MTKRLDPKARTVELLATSLRLARTHGWHSLTHASVAAAAGVSVGLVVARLGTMDALRRSVMRAAVRDRCAAVVAQGLAVGDKHARRADEALRAEAADRVRAA